MKSKKDRPKADTFERSGPGLAAAKRNGLRQARREYVGPAPGTARKPDAAGQMEDCRCPACNGTGVCSS